MNSSFFVSTLAHLSIRVFPHPHHLQRRRLSPHFHSHTTTFSKFSIHVPMNFAYFSAIQGLKMISLEELSLLERMAIVEIINSIDPLVLNLTKTFYLLRFMFNIFKLTATGKPCHVTSADLSKSAYFPRVLSTRQYG